MNSRIGSNGANAFVNEANESVCHVHTYMVLFDLYDLLWAFRVDDEETDAREGYVRNPASHSSQVGGSGSSPGPSTRRIPPGVHVLVF